MGLLRGEPSLSVWRASRLLLLAAFLRFLLPLGREVGGQQHLESLGEVFHEMPFVGDLDRLRRSFERSCRIFGRPVSADQLDAWMRCEPSGNGFYRPIRQQVNGHGPFEITQERPITMSTFPGPVVDANLFGGHRSRKLSGSDETQNGITTPTQALLAADLCSCLPSYGLSQLAQSSLQPLRPLGVRTTKLWKLFRKNLSWTGALFAEEATHLNEKSDCTPAGRKIVHRPAIAALHP